MNAKEIGALADRIAEARRGRRGMDFLAAATADLSEADSYKVQFAVHDRLTGNGPVCWAGLMVTFPFPLQYPPLTLSGPVFAGIYVSRVRTITAELASG